MTDPNAQLADAQDNLSQNIVLKYEIELLCKCGYEENENNSCSFELNTSSNIDCKVTRSDESVMFVELFFQLTHKNWKDKLEKMNRFI